MPDRLRPNREEQNQEHGEEIDVLAAPKEGTASQYTDALVEIFEQHFGAEASESRKAMAREIADTFFRETLQNADAHESIKNGAPYARYPWGVIDTGILTKKIYEKVTGKTI